SLGGRVRLRSSHLDERDRSNRRGREHRGVSFSPDARRTGRLRRQAAQGLTMRARSTHFVLLFAAACSGYHPPRFAVRPPAAEVRDDAPIPVPRWRWVPESVYLSEVYLHRPLREAIDLSHYPDAGDVNSMAV